MTAETTTEKARRMRAHGLIGLGVAAVAITGLGLGGPLMLVATGDPSPVLPYYPVGWAVAIGGWLFWLFSWRAAGRVAREHLADETLSAGQDDR